MEKIEKVKQEIRDNIKWSTKKPERLGGQQCGLQTYPVVLKSEELEFEITIGFHRSGIKNQQLALTLFELALDDMVK